MEVLAAGERILNVFPAIALGDVAPRMAGKTLHRGSGQRFGIAADVGKIDATRLAGVSDLQSIQAELDSVAGNQLTDSALAQAPLLAQVRSAQVMKVGATPNQNLVRLRISQNQ